MSEAVACIGDTLKGRRGGLGKFHCEAVGAEVAPELLTEQNLHIGLIIDHENERVHMRSPDFIRDAPARGRTIQIGELAGLGIDLYRPAMLLDDDVVTDGETEPVPSPAGFVVKNGLNIFSLTSTRMPVPLSRILISTRSPRFFVVAVRVGSYSLPSSCSLRFVAA